jgi:CTP:molybdopterin cytidylyltransferase MocA
MTDPQQTIFAAVLAAGCSSRFGTTKQAVALDGVPLVRRAVHVATEVCENRVVTVIGHDSAVVLKAMNSHSGFVVVNEDYEQGLGSSIATAARVCYGSADALLLLLADQPFVTAEHLRQLIDTWSEQENEIVATAYSGTQGPPALFPRGAFDALVSLTGDRGARAIFSDSRFSLKTVQFEPAAIDIDTREDLSSLT